MNDLRVLVESDIVLGKPLGGAVCDQSGKVLANPGLIISTAAQRERLLTKNLYLQSMPEPQADPSSPLPDNAFPPGAGQGRLTSAFQLIDQLSSEWAAIATLFQADEQHWPIAVAHVENLARDIQNLVRRYISPALAALQLNTGRDYALIKSLHVAAICELLGQRVGMADPKRRSLICAALTYDMAMPSGDFQIQAAPLSDQQRRDIRDHPEKGRQLLFEAGVRDNLWLSAVLQHHERGDGSGYPEGLKGAALSLPSKILAITDTYCAMVRPRADRAKVVAKDVLEEFFQARAASIDAEMVALFIHELGVYPPGTVVRLACGELAIVTDRGRDPAFPQVDTICLADGRFLDRSLPRDSGNPAYRVIEIESRPEHMDMPRVLADVWQGIPRDVFRAAR